MKKRVFVVIGSLCVNSMLGSLYTWGILKLVIKTSIEMSDGGFFWKISSLNYPYAFACLTGSVGMIVGGWLQKRIDSRFIVIFGGVLGGLGFILISKSYSLIMWILGFGVFVGIGMGIVYSTLLPLVLKFFPSHRSGIMTGIVTTGFSLAPLYLAPLMNFSIKHWGIMDTMFFFGVLWLFFMFVFSFFLVRPPDKDGDDEGKGELLSIHRDYYKKKVLNILKVRSFWLLWFSYMISSGIGLIFIGDLTEIATKSMKTSTWTVIVTLAIGNTFGRILSGMLSDFFGRIKVLLIILIFQILVVLVLLFLGEVERVFMMIFISVLLGFNYGGYAAVFPVLVKEYFGSRDFAMNNALFSTAWGVGGFLLPLLSEIIKFHTDGFFCMCFFVIILLLFAFRILLYFNNEIK